MGAAAHAALERLARRTGVGGARQHRVLGGHPALTFTFEPARHTLGEGCGAQHAGVAELDERGALSVAGPTAGDGDGAQLVEGAAVFAGSSHGFSLNLSAGFMSVC